LSSGGSRTRATTPWPRMEEVDASNNFVSRGVCPTVTNSMDWLLSSLSLLSL
jgi:hypothetical protein